MQILAKKMPSPTDLGTLSHWINLEVKKCSLDSNVLKG